MEFRHADPDSREEKTILREQQSLVASFVIQKADTEMKMAELSKSVEYGPTTVVERTSLRRYQELCRVSTCVLRMRKRSPNHDFMSRTNLPF